MSIANVDEIIIPAGEDYHTHLRHGDLMNMVVPHVRKGGICRALIMPNLTPPITTLEQVVAYKSELEGLDSSVEYLMTLYLHPSLTPEIIAGAKAVGVTGVKSYPRGVTTNSEAGIESYDVYYPIFEAMETAGLILHLHGEIPSNPDNDVCVMNAERSFLSHLEKLHAAFPKLRIILEHSTTKEAVALVKKLGPTVAATITAHHLELTVDDWAGQPHNFCKPVAKYPSDRAALRAVVKEGNPKFFLGSDSAPHDRTKKESCCGSAGVFTTPLLMPYVVTTLLEMGCTSEQIVGFTSANGRAFYDLPDLKQNITLVKESATVPQSYAYGEAGEVVPFKAGQTLAWSLRSQ
ncbi:dihydroorotase [Sphaeroforma arctica JP610]|uniref:dihydroorotase n=1 Tax=Sphaeroforma arctica JP610 TaxID=667725 RepID=A0A0L0FKS9_9EUKA|nr:dihydroorotase [Sphaeroforma arctica JP610]KNC77392.1 dihydroorotase [Sphaeroforma arctica JP610]|eukprot:XP_014151294.1 dihydroorotase [Sphaeroforma arctica JP610]